MWDKEIRRAVAEHSNRCPHHEAGMNATFGKFCKGMRPPFLPRRPG